MWIIEAWIFSLFPRGIFAIGQGEKRHQYLLWLRRTVIFGTLLSVAVRILWALFTKRP
jgi:hypothetical protein